MLSPKSRDRLSRPQEIGVIRRLRGVTGGCGFMTENRCIIEI
jgi:hypothetical protein